MAEEQTVQATLKWAQREAWVYVTIDLQDVKDESIEVTPEGSFSFKGTSNEKVYAAKTELFDKLNIEESKWVVRARSIDFALKKAESKWWDRLTKEGGKKRWIKTDWDRWADEDDDGYDNELDTGDMGMMGGGGMDFASMMGGMGGGGLPGGMDLASMMKNMPTGDMGGDDDADDAADAGADEDGDDELPPLEEVA